MKFEAYRNRRLREVEESTVYGMPARLHQNRRQTVRIADKQEVGGRKIANRLPRTQTCC